VSKDSVNLEADGQTLRMTCALLRLACACTRVRADSPDVACSVQQQKTEEEGAPGTRWHRVERSSQFASRALRFPDDADLSKARRVANQASAAAMTHPLTLHRTQVNANLDAGVLRVTIPKRPEAAPKRQTIKVA
jgi:HSP20 family molecular chaperone IbpA